MTLKEKMMLTEGIYMIAFGYTACGYAKAGAAFGICALLLSIEAHTWQNTAACAKDALVPVLVQLSLIKILKMDVMMPCLGALAVCNTLSAFLFHTDNDEETDSVLRMMTWFLMITFVLVLVIPADCMPFQSGNAEWNLLCLLVYAGFVYVPAVGLYVQKVIRFVKELDSVYMDHPQ